MQQNIYFNDTIYPHKQLLYCSFSSPEQIQMPIFLKECQYTCWIKNKAFDEGIYRIVRNKILESLINDWLLLIEAKNILYMDTVFINYREIKQFEKLYGTFSFK